MVAAPTGRGRGRRYDLSEQQRLMIADRGARLRVMGNSWREVTEQLRKEFPEVNPSETSVIKWVNDRIKPAAEESIANLRQQQLEEIELAKKAIMKRVEKGDDKALQALDRLQARQAKLMGLDAPVQVQMEQKVVDHQTQAQVFLERMLANKATGGIVSGEVINRAIEG